MERIERIERTPSAIATQAALQEKVIQIHNNRPGSVMGVYGRLTGLPLDGVAFTNTKEDTKSPYV